MRERRKDPIVVQRERELGSRWRELRPEEWWIGRRRKFRDWWFFHKGKPVGPFDPIEMRDSSLLRAVEELREGKLKPPKRDNV
jgi:hypothetical protein